MVLVFSFFQPIMASQIIQISRMMVAIPMATSSHWLCSIQLLSDPMAAMNT